MASRKRAREERDAEQPIACLWRGCASAVFETEEELYQHVNTVHVTQKGPCLWDACEYVAGEKQRLKEHMRMHTGERPQECKTCHKTFSKSCSLTKHMRIHTGERPYECETCHKTFARLDTLSIHILTHTGERPHECETCHKTFSKLDNLTTHMRIHTGERPYKCELCKVEFAQSAHLTSHKIRWHIGPWCVLCGECYVPEETMVCGRCNMRQRFGVKERTFFDFIHKYDERLTECCFTLRDQAMGCGVRKRPDGLMQLQTKAACVTIDQSMETVLQENDYRVKLIIEADEHQHSAYEPSCELVRLQEMQERDGDALYVLRYNVDQSNGLDEAMLSAFCQRLLQILDGDFVRAIESEIGLEIEYFGYTERRRDLLEAEFKRQQGLSG
jgi:hypothetical protein